MATVPMDIREIRQTVYGRDMREPIADACEHLRKKVTAKEIADNQAWMQDLTNRLENLYKNILTGVESIPFETEYEYFYKNINFDNIVNDNNKNMKVKTSDITAVLDDPGDPSRPVSAEKTFSYNGSHSSSDDQITFDLRQGEQCDVLVQLTDARPDSASNTFNYNTTHSSESDRLALDILKDEQCEVLVKLTDPRAASASTSFSYTTTHSSENDRVSLTAINGEECEVLVQLTDERVASRSTSFSYTNTHSSESDRLALDIRKNEQCEMLVQLADARPASVEKTVTLTGSHSSESDRLSCDIRKGEKCKITVTLSNGQALGGAVTCKDSSGTVVGEVGFTSGTPKEFTVSEDILSSFGFYLPAPSTNVTALFKVERTQSIIPVLSGACVCKNSAGTEVQQAGFSTGTDKQFTLTADAASFGVYIPDPPYPMTATFSVRRSVSVLPVLAGACVCKNASGTEVQQAGFSTGTAKKFTMEDTAASFGVYIPDPPYPMTASFRVKRTASILPVLSGACVCKNSGGTEVQQAGFTTGTAKQFTLTADAASFGVYIPDPPYPMTASFRIRRTLSNPLVVSGSLVIRDSSGTDIQNVGFSTGTAKQFVAAGNSAKFGVYLPNYVPATALFRLTRIVLLKEIEYMLVSVLSGSATELISGDEYKWNIPNPITETVVHYGEDFAINLEVEDRS